MEQMFIYMLKACTAGLRNTRFSPLYHNATYCVKLQVLYKKVLYLISWIVKVRVIVQDSCLLYWNYVASRECAESIECAKETWSGFAENTGTML